MSDQFRLSKIGVVMLGVTSLENSVPFYRDRLGLKLSGQFGPFAFFDADGQTLALTLDLPKFTGKLAGATEVVFAVEHVRAAHEALQKQGVEFIREPRQVAGPNWGANFRDPDGHLLSIFGPE
jgi:catechol 2,3-dioxygenase-like lactoylglutathione lyase family enzyme